MSVGIDEKNRSIFRSNRVKGVDMHPKEPWVLATLHDGHAHIYNYATKQLIKTFDICTVPVRCGRFVERKNWIVTASDDMFVRIYDYHTTEKIHEFRAHTDFIRSLVVHPSQSYILTSSDDMTIKLWDWNAEWTLKQTFQGHTHYVMQVAINPKDEKTFASASLDCTIKIWHFDSSQPIGTFEGHEKGVNSVNFGLRDHQLYLVSGSDDQQVKIWNYQDKTCVQTLEGHSNNVDCVVFHSELSVILSGSEDGTIKIWDSDTYTCQSTYDFALGRCWTISCLKGGNSVALGYDEGTVLIQVSGKEPTPSFDASIDPTVD